MLAADGVPDLALHDHFCFVYERDADARRAVRDYAVAGLARHERVCVLTEQDAVTAGIDDDLRAAGLPVEDLMDGGALVFGSAAQTYLARGVFEPDKRLEAYADAARSAVAEGHTGLRIYAETQFLLEHTDALAVWPGYELRAGLLLKQIPMTAVCAYDARRWAPAAIVLAEMMHARRSRHHEAFSFHADRDGAARLSGEIDFAVADQVYRLLARTTPGRPTPVLDVSGVTFVDLSGARAVGLACEAIAGQHGPTTIRGAPRLFHTIWKGASMSKLFPNMIVEDRQ